MPSSFRIYIDESGDEGFAFKPAGAGSSEWFVISAAITRTSNDLALVSCMRESRAMLGKPVNQPLHFQKMEHGQRLAWVQKIASQRIRSISVFVHKPSIQDPEVFKSTPYHLYRYCSRLLMERVSWFCRDSHDPSKGDGTSEIFFSNRRKMSYTDLREYWQKLKDQNNPKDIRIAWDYIDPAKIAAVNHDQMAGLQIADAIASSHFKSVSLDRFGNNEPRYFLELNKVIYRRNKAVFGYGIKFWPTFETLRPSNMHLSVFDGL